MTKRNPNGATWVIAQRRALLRAILVCLLPFQALAAEPDVSATQASGEEDAGKPAGASAEKTTPSHWGDLFKNIPLGPCRLDIGGSMRFRWEFQDDFNIQRYADQRRRTSRRDGFLLQRLRVDFNLRFPDDARIYGELQDSRAYNSDFSPGDFALGCPYWNYVDLRQAYVEWLHIGSTPFGIKAGRQIISYGDNRIWGPGEWGNVGRYTWDAVKLIADTRPLEAHLIFANRVKYDTHDCDHADRNLDACGAYVMLKNLPCRLDLFWVYKHTSPRVVINSSGGTAEFDTHTVGAYVDGKFGTGWDYRGTFAHTFGRRDGATVEAYGANARLGYTFDVPWKPRVGVEYSYASGDPDPADGRYRTFDGVFGAIAKTYGRMNLFSWMNIHDYQASFSCRPLEKTRVSLDWHFFRLDKSTDAWYYCNGRSQRRDPTGRAGSSVGQEIDIVAQYQHSEHLKFQAGYALFFPGNFLRNTGPHPDADWAFFQVMYAF